MPLNLPPWNSHEGPELPSGFTTEAQLAERRNGRRRIIWAVAISLASLAAFIIFGPDAESVKKRFEYYGTQGEMRIMPDISIEDGRDKIRQLPKSLQTPPPPSRLEIEPEEQSENATDPTPLENKNPVNDVINDVTQPTPDAEISTNELVEMALPMQSNPEYYLIKSPMPLYPLSATEAERRTPLTFVIVNLFVNAEGMVTDTLIQSTNGRRVYADEVVKAVMQWEFGWRKPHLAGGWITTRFNFKSPYFTQMEMGF